MYKFITIIVPLIVTLEIYLQNKWRHFSETGAIAADPFDYWEKGSLPMDSFAEALLDRLPLDA